MGGLLSSFLNPSAPMAGALNTPGRYFFGNSNDLLRMSKSGVAITADVAMRHSAVYACVKALSEDIAKLPIFVYERLKDGGREKKPRSGLHRLLHDRPNKWQTSFEWREMMMGHVLLRGNAFSLIVPGGGGMRPSGAQDLIPLHPDRVSIHGSEMEGVEGYHYTDKDGREIPIHTEDMWHLRGLSSDGYQGVSVIAAMAESVGLSIAAEQHGGSTFRNAAQVPFAITHPGNGQSAFDRLQDRVRAQHQGSGNAGKILYLEEGMGVEKLGMTGRDSQFLETREFQVPDIARFFRIPPHKIQDLRRSTFSNIEHQSIEYVTDSLQPWVSRFEGTTKRSLLANDPDHFVELALQGLMRGDSAARSAFLNSAISAGWMTRNEARQLENLNKGPEELDEYLQPMNMQVAGEDPEPPAPPPMMGTPEPEPEEDEDEEDEPEAKTRLETIARSACARLVHHETTTIGKYAIRYSANGDGWQKWLDGYYEKHAERIVDALSVSKEVAAEYVSGQRQEIGAHGMNIVTSWGEEQVERLYALIQRGELT